MNFKRLGTTCIILIVTFFILEMVIHGVILNGMYEQTASVWRGKDEMMQLMPWMYLGEAIFALTFGVIYAYGFDPKRKPRVWQGLRFGILMAFLIAPMTSLSWYVILPIPGVLASYEFIASVVEMLALGLVAGLVYKR